MDKAITLESTSSRLDFDRHEIQVDKFSGPLDLLLYLIRRDELDIIDIPIARITRQFLDYVDILRSLDLEVAGEYILMAATLIRIKAQMLLPRPEVEGEEEDPRGSLVAALLEYQQFKEASGVLHQYESNERPRFANPGNMPARRIDETLRQDVTVYDLVTAMGEMLKRVKKDDSHEVFTDQYTVEDKIESICNQLKYEEYIQFSDLVGDPPTRALVVVTFLALLELCRLHTITIEQVAPLANIRIRRQVTVEALEGGA